MLFLNDFLHNQTNFYYITYEKSGDNGSARYVTPFKFDSFVDAIAFLLNTDWFYVCEDGLDTFEHPGNTDIKAFILKQDDAMTAHQVRRIQKTLDVTGDFYE